jgi:hypothetical protein
MVSERKGGHRTGHQASGRRSPTADSFGGGIPPESNGPPAYVVCTCGDSQVEKPARVLLWPIPANHLKGRDVRQRRRTGHKVVGVGRVYQALLVLVTATPLPCPRPSFTGHDGGLLVSMRVRQHPVQAGLHAAAWARPARMQRLQQVRRHTARHCATETRREDAKGRGGTSVRTVSDGVPGLGKRH